MTPLGRVISFAYLAFGSFGSALRDASSTTVDEAFQTFVAQHRRTYRPGSEEYAKRRIIFASTVERVRAQNSQPKGAWKASINKLADRTVQELSMLRGWKGSRRPGYSSASTDSSSSAQLLSTISKVVKFPDEFSWTNLTTVQEVQDQGSCGSCWAFASATVLRAHSEIWMRNPRKFSVQQIVSCTPNPKECGGTGGCEGATAELAMDYVLKNGCRSEADLPYTQKDDSCPHSFLQVQPPSANEPTNSAYGGASLGMIGWSKLPENKLAPLKTALVTKGPVAVSIAAGHSWNQYGGGVLDDCPKDAIIDHAVVLIGYGHSKALIGGAEVKYWHLQNSWGTDWGEEGYIRMLRFDDKFEEKDQCGTDNNPRIGSGCKGGPDEIYVCGMCGILYDTVIPHFSNSQLQRKATVKKKQQSFLHQH